MAQVLLHPFHRPVSTCTPPLPLPSLPPSTCIRVGGINFAATIRQSRLESAGIHARTHTSPLPSPPLRARADPPNDPTFIGEGEGGGSKDPDGFGPIRAPNLFRFIAFLIHKFLFNLICRHCYGNTAWKRCISSASSFSQPSLFYSSLSLSLSFLVFFVPLLLSRGSSWTFLIPFLYFSFLFFSFLWIFGEEEGLL